MTSTLPLVSIGMPVYNGERWLSRALDSLLGQDYSNLELIISNNCSTDNTATICERYARQDPRVRYSCNEMNIGANSNFHRVLHLARGEFFMWAACDDDWSTSFVSKLLHELVPHSHAAVAMSAIERVTEDRSRYDLIRFSDDVLPCLNELTSFELFKHARYGVHLYLFFYGLWRADFLRSVLRQAIPEVPAGDMRFMEEVVLATRFRYVDEILHTRTVHMKNASERYPTEKWSQLTRQGNWTSADHLRVLRNRIWWSKVIPFPRKLAALAWLRLQGRDLRSYPGGGLLYGLYRALAPKLG